MKNFLKAFWIDIRMLFGMYTPKFKVGDEVVRLVYGTEAWNDNICYLLVIKQVGKSQYLIDNGEAGVAMSIAIVDTLCQPKEDVLVSSQNKFSIVQGGRKSDPTSDTLNFLAEDKFSKDDGHGGKGH